MLFWFVIVNWIISIGIGPYAATRMHKSRGFAIAGRPLPFYIFTATVPGIPAIFLKEGLPGMVANPLPQGSEYEQHHLAASLIGHVAKEQHHNSPYNQT